MPESTEERAALPLLFRSGMALVILAVVIVAGVVLKDLSSTQTGASDRFTNALSALEMSAELQYQTQEARRILLYALATDDHERQVAYVDQSRQTDDRVGVLLDLHRQLAQTSEAQQGVVEALAQDWMAYVSVRNALIASMLKGNTPAAVEMDQQEGVPTFNKVRSDVEELKKLMRGDADRIVQEVNRSFGNSITRLSMVAGLTLLAAFLVAKILQRSGLVRTLRASEASLRADFEAIERAKAETAARLLRYQKALLDLSQVNATSFQDRLTLIIQTSAEVLRVERVSFWSLVGGNSALRRETQYFLAERRFDSELVRLEAKDYPIYFKAVKAGRGLIVCDDARRHPLLAELVGPYLAPLGIQSLLNAPVHRGGRLLGVICLEHTGPARVWSAEEQDFARSVAQLVALAIETRGRERAEAARSQLAAIIEATPDFVGSVDPEGRMRFVNSAGRRMAGCDEDEDLSTAQLCDFHPPRVAKLIQEEGLKIACQEGVWANEGMLLTRDGREIPISQVILAHKDPSGVLQYYSTMARDISERVRSERQLQETSRRVGMAEVAVSVLHNVGNVLNSANVSALLLLDQVRKSRVARLSEVAGLLCQHAGDLTAFLTTDPTGSRLPEFLARLAERLQAEQATSLREIEALTKSLGHMKEIVAMQQSHAKVSGIIESLRPEELVDDALEMNAASFNRHGVQVVREFESAPKIQVDKFKVLQILVNLLSNAKQALDSVPPREKRLTIRIRCGSADRVQVSVADNGAGIAPENLTRIFGHGFSTKADGHGFGLHHGALAAKELGGALSAESPGPGLGACFTLELPVVSS